MTPDLAQLRKLAEAAHSGDDHEWYGRSSFEGRCFPQDIRLICAASPAVILALGAANEQ